VIGAGKTLQHKMAFYHPCSSCLGRNRPSKGKARCLKRQNLCLTRLLIQILVRLLQYRGLPLRTPLWWQTSREITPQTWPSLWTKHPWCSTANRLNNFLCSVTANLPSRNSSPRATAGQFRPSRNSDSKVISRISSLKRTHCWLGRS
jgi:hypothetical protein